MSVSIVLKTISGAVITSDKVISFSFRKDAYIAYTSLNARFVVLFNVASCSAETIYQIKLMRL